MDARVTRRVRLAVWAAVATAGALALTAAPNATSGAPAGRSATGAPRGTSSAGPAEASQPRDPAPGRGKRDEGSPSRPSRVLSLTIKAPITTGTAEYVESGLARAKRDGFDAIAITLDTPGGHLEATRDIVQRMLASEVPVVVWVGPAGARAGSAGVFITMAAHLAGMHPTSNIGAAHPVTSGGRDVEDEAGKDMAKKVENDTAAFIRSIASTRQRNADWAEKAVRQSISATAEEARKLGVIDLVSPSLEELLASGDGRVFPTPAGQRSLHARDAKIEPQDMTVRQRTLAVLSDPNIAALLFLIGTLGIALELYHPGSIFPGAVGAFCLLLAFLAMRIIPVNVGAVILLVAGVALLVVEGYVTTHGVAGAGGVVALVIGTLLFVDKSSPEYHFDPGTFTLSPLVVWPTPIALAAILGFVAYKLVQSRRGRQVAGESGLVGESGEALTDLGPGGGEVFVHGEYWRGRAEAPILRGARVRVVAVDGLLVTVVADAPKPG